MSLLLLLRVPRRIPFERALIRTARIVTANEMTKREMRRGALDAPACRKDATDPRTGDAMHRPYDSEGPVAAYASRRTLAE